MSDIITKAQSASNAVEDSSFEPWQRVKQALDSISGLSLSDLDGDAKVKIEAELVAINQITESYAFESFDEYEALSVGDVEEILRRIATINWLCIDSEAKQVMHALDTAGRKLPTAAIEEVRKHPDIFVPLITQSLQQAISKVRDGEKPQGDAPFFALFLLTELKVVEAFPVIQDAFRLPDEGPFELFGDGLIEIAPKILAQLANGNIEVLDDFVRNSNLDTYLRWTAVSAYKFLVRDGSISREVAVNSLHLHFQESVTNEDYEMLAPLTCALGDLAAACALESVRTAYARNQVDEVMINFEFFESQIEAGDATVNSTLSRCPSTGIPDTIAELSEWYSFQEQPDPPQNKNNPLPTSFIMPARQAEDFASSTTSATIRTGEKVGRNDPCSCGSGKKYKKCCGRN